MAEEEEALLSPPLPKAHVCLYSDFAEGRRRERGGEGRDREGRTERRKAAKKKEKNGSL